MKIAINFFNTVLSKNEITIPYLSFKDRDQLVNLRNSNSEAIFMRSKERILFWGTDSVSAEGIQNVIKEEDHNLLSNILAYSLLQQFYQTATNLSLYFAH